MSSRSETRDLFFVGLEFGLGEALAERNYILHQASKPEYVAHGKFDAAQTFLSMVCTDSDVTNILEAVLDEQDSENT